MPPNTAPRPQSRFGRPPIGRLSGDYVRALTWRCQTSVNAGPRIPDFCLYERLNPGLTFNFEIEDGLIVGCREVEAEQS
jgi:hypothetical protein